MFSSFVEYPIAMSYSVEQLQKINWPLVLSLLAFSFSILLGADVLHQQLQLLEYFPTNTIQLVDILVVILIPVLSGLLLDQLVKRTSKAQWLLLSGLILSFITLGVGIYLSFASSGSSLIATVILLLWIFSMSLLVAPTISLLRLMIPIELLPIAMSIFIALKMFFIASTPLFQGFYFTVGIQVSLIIALVVVLASGIFYFLKAKPLFLERNQVINETTNDVESGIPAAVITGLFAGLSFSAMQFAYRYLLSFEHFDIFGFDHNYVPYFLALVSGLLALTASKFIRVVEPRPSFLIGLILFVIAFFLVLYRQEIPFMMASGIIMAVSYTLIAMSSLPYIYSSDNPYQLGLVTGIFFGISELIPKLVDYYLVQG